MYYFDKVFLSDKVLKKLFLLFNTKKEVSGCLFGCDFYIDEHRNLQDFPLLNDCKFFSNSDVKKNDKSKFKYVKNAIGYFHSHISGDLRLSFNDKFLLFLFWLLNQNLSIVYGIENKKFVLIFYKFSLRGCYVYERLEYDFMELFNQYCSNLYDNLNSLN